MKDLKNKPFIGRKKELADLDRFTQKSTSSLIVIRGRRRIGKSRLVKEFAKSFDTFYTFSGVAPTKETTHQSQLDEFSAQLSKQLNMPEFKVNDWNKLFWLLAEKVKKGKTLLFFDEISWMGSKDSDFLGKIKNAWDMYFSDNPALIFIICGSASSWIEKNILSSTGFLGRVSYTLTVREVKLQDCIAFWGSYSKNISAYEKLKMLSITGGVPKYLEEINPKVSAEDNIKDLCFRPGGLLVNEFDNIFSDLFLHNSAVYRQIVSMLASGAKDTQEIAQLLGTEPTGRLSDYLDELKLAGFVSRDYTWHLKTGHDSKLSRYRLSDNYLRFYVKYVEPYRTQIERDNFEVKTLTALPEFSTILGLQFENLVLNNRHEIHAALRLRAEDIINENPFFQRATSTQQGCQIDYMIQTKFNTLYVVEIKFLRDQIGETIIKEVQQKIDRLTRTRAYSVRPVLVHVNGISPSVVESGYFAAIIDFGSLLEI